MHLKIKAKQFDPLTYPWPFKAPKMNLFIDLSRLAIWVRHKGRDYAVNGNAIDIGGHDIKELYKPGVKNAQGVINQVVENIFKPMGLL